MADGGIKGGMMYGETDNFSSNVVANPIDIHDLSATISDLSGYDHEQLTCRHQGHDYCLTDITDKL